MDCRSCLEPLNRLKGKPSVLRRLLKRLFITPTGSWAVDQISNRLRYFEIFESERTDKSQVSLRQAALDFNDETNLDGALRLNLEIRTRPLGVPRKKYEKMFTP